MGLGAELAGRCEMLASWTAAKPSTTKPAKAPVIWPGPHRGTVGGRTGCQGRRDRAPDRGSKWHTGPQLSGRARDRHSAPRLHPLSPECLWQLWRDGRAGDRCGGRGAGDPAGLSDNRGSALVNPVKRTNKAVEGWGERSAVRLPGREPLVLCEGASKPRCRSGRQPVRRFGLVSASRTSAARPSPRRPR